MTLLAVWLLKESEIWIDMNATPKVVSTLVWSFLGFMQTKKSITSAVAVYISTCLFFIGSWVPIVWSNNRTLSILSGIAIVKLVIVPLDCKYVAVCNVFPGKNISEGCRAELLAFSVLIKCFFFQVWFIHYSQWQERENSIWIAYSFSCSLENCSGSNCKGWLLNFAGTRCECWWFMVYKGHSGKVCAILCWPCKSSNYLINFM